MTDDATLREDPRSLAPVIASNIDSVVELFTPQSVFGHLLNEHMGVITQLRDGRLLGKGYYTVFYCPLARWADTEANTVLGKWIYGEWSETNIKKETEFGESISGSRVVLAQGTAVKSGNGTGVALSHMGVGLIKEADGHLPTAHFLGAATMKGTRKVDGPMPEHEFFSAMVGFIRTFGDRSTPMVYPLKSGGRK